MLNILPADKHGKQNHYNAIEKQNLLLTIIAFFVMNLRVFIRFVIQDSYILQLKYSLAVLPLSQDLHGMLLKREVCHVRSLSNYATIKMIWLRLR